MPGIRTSALKPDYPQAGRMDHVTTCAWEALAAKTLAPVEKPAPATTIAIAKSNTRVKSAGRSVQLLGLKLAAQPVVLDRTSLHSKIGNCCEAHEPSVC